MTRVCTAPRLAVVAEDVRDLQRLSGHARLGGRLELQILQWAFDLVQEMSRDLAIAGGVLELLVPQQYLDDADVLVVLEQVGGKSVAQRMQRNRLIDLGRSTCLVKDPVELTGREWVERVLSRKYPAPR